MTVVIDVPMHKTKQLHVFGMETLWFQNDTVKTCSCSIIKTAVFSINLYVGVSVCVCVESG